MRYNFKTKKHRANSVAALLSNWQNVEAAVKSASEAEGSAARENAKYVNSIQGRLDKMTTSWQSFANTFMSSDFLKGAISALTSFIESLEKVIETVGTFPALTGTIAAGFSLFKNTGFISVLNKDIAGAQKQLSLLGKSFKDISRDMASGQGLFKSLFSKSITKSDVGYITEYFKQVKSGVPVGQAYANTLSHASVAGKQMAVGIKKGTASMSSLKTATIGGKAALFGLEAAATAANIALTMGLSFAIQLVVEGIMKLVNADKELAESVEEITSKFKEQHDELSKLKNDYDTTNESSMISKYAKLSKGVDGLGRNISLTADEYSEYQNIVNNIAEQIPSLVNGYDSQGNALLSCKGNVEELTTAYEKLIHLQNQEILSTNAQDIEKNWKNVLKQANGYDLFERIGNTWSLNWLFGDNDMKTWDMKTDTAKWLSGLTSNTSDAEIEKGLGNWDSFRRAEVVQALQNAGYTVDTYSDISKVLKEALEKEPHKIRNILDTYYAQFNDAIAQYKTKSTALLSEAFDVSSAISGLNYGGISDELREIAYQTVNSLDFDFFNELSKKGKTIDQWTTEMLNQLNTINQEDSTSISAAFDLQTQFNGGEIPYGEYVEGLEDTGKLIERLNLKPELESQLKLSLGLDEKGLVDGYQKLKNRLADSTEFNIMPNEYEHFIKGLSAEEVSVLWKVIPELEESDYKETIADIKAALENEMMLQGLTFDLNLEVESDGLEALNTALSESVSATGLSSESIEALRGRYARLESQGYDLSSMFEETSTGIRLNRQEFDKLEKAYAKQKLADIDGDLAEMKSAYDDLGEAIKNCDDPIKKSELFNDRQTLAKRISEAATLASQYEGLTSAYNDWLSAEEAGQERDMYENIISGFETVDDEISRGWIDDGAIEFLELLTGRTDLAGKSGKQLKEIYDGLDDTIKNTTYSIRDFFTVDEDGNSTNAGVYNFLDAIGQLEEEKFGGKDVVKRDKDGNVIGFDFELAGGDEVIAEALGVSEELVQIMVRAADDAGFVVSMDGTYRQLADLQNEAKAAADYLHKIGKTNFEFDFNTSSVENLKTQLTEAHKILDSKEFWNKDGTFNFNAKGATEAMTIVSTLQAKLDSLSAEQYGIGLTVEDEEFEEPLENLQDYGHKVATLNQLELNPKANVEEIEKINGELNEIAQEFNELPDEKKVKLGLVDDKGNPLNNIEDIRKKIESGEVTIPTVLDIQANMDKNIETLADLALLNSGLLSESQEETIRKKYKIEVEADEVDTSDVDEKVDEVVRDGRGGSQKREADRKANIEIIAETFGVEDVDGLTSKLKNLDDKTIQAIAEVLGDVEVDKLKLALGTMTDVQIKAIAEAIGKGDVDALKTAIGNLDSNTVQAIAEAFGYNDVNELIGAIDNLDPKIVQAVAQALGLGDVNTLQITINNMQGNTVDAKVNTDGQASKVDTLQTKINSLKGKIVTVGVQLANAGKKKAAQRTGADLSPVNGTANVNGTIGRTFKQGSWGTKNSGTALVGELGREVLVRDGKYYTIGDNGAEFIKYKKGDIIFNHVQSEQLFRNGKVTYGGGRGKAFVEGTAFSKGTGGFGKVITRVDASGTKKEEVKTDTKTATNKSKKKNITVKNTTEVNVGGSSGSGGGLDKVEGQSGKTTKEDVKEFEEVFDWIETAISRIEREIDNLDRTANNVYKSWSDRNKALASEISKVSEEINLQSNAAQEYLKKANSVGLDETWAKKVRNGALDIDTLNEKNSSEELIEKIKNYQKW